MRLKPPNGRFQVHLSARALRGVVALVLALALPAHVWSADFQVGVEALKRGDYPTALEEWLPLAEQGDAAAQFSLGFMYELGMGITQDNAEAVKWYRLAAEQGHAYGQATLASMYAKGTGVIQDYVLAHMWFNLAAARAPPDETRNLFVITRDLTEKHMTPDQVAEAQRLAREWKPK